MGSLQPPGPPRTADAPAGRLPNTQNSPSTTSSVVLRRSTLNMGTFRYRSAVTPDTTYSHQNSVSGAT